MPQNIERLTRSVIITSTGASNHIEDNHLTDSEVEKLHNNLQIKKFKTCNKQGIVEYLQCLELVFDNYQEIFIIVPSILKLHPYLVKKYRS